MCSEHETPQDLHCTREMSWEHHVPSQLHIVGEKFASEMVSKKLGQGIARGGRAKAECERTNPQPPIPPL